MTLALLPTAIRSHAAPAPGGADEQGKVMYIPLAGPGKKTWIDPEHYFEYEFDKKPAMGPLIVKIRLYTRDGKRATDLEIKGSADMPSMRGAHYSGDQPFRLSKKGDYLLPVDVVMPGDWEIRLIFLKAGRVLFRGALTFDV